MSHASAPGWWTPVAAVALLWNLLGIIGVAAELMVTEEAIAQMEPAIAAVYADAPLWPKFGSVLAVLGGTLGSVALLMRQRWAVAAFAASLVGLVIQNVHAFLLSDLIAVMGGTVVILPLIVMAIAGALLALARHGVAQGWLDGAGSTAS
jgi:hypothetical protein